MQNDNLNDTLPSAPQPDGNDENDHLAETQMSPAIRDGRGDTSPTQPISVDALEVQEIATSAVSDVEEPSDGKKKRSKWFGRLGIIISIFFGLVAVGALSGYGVGMGDRKENEELQRAKIAAEQFQLAQMDMDKGDYTTAVQRLEYVIRIFPEFPGGAEKLTIALLASQSTATPTIIPTSTLEPTPDNREVDELYQQALNAVAAEDWDTVLSNLDTIRKAMPDYRTVDIDGLYYIALRNRGVKKILNDGDLEGGIYDLNQAEVFAPIDAQAASYRQWAEWYQTGASFWEVDWEQAVYYFNMIVPVAPNLMDSSFFTAQSRLATAQVGYADVLIKRAENYMAEKYWCSADELIKEAASYKPLDPEDLETANYVASKCELSPNSFAP